MNPFEYIEDMKQVLKSEVANNGIKGSDTITMKEHYTKMMNMLNILEEEMKEAEYHYQVVAFQNKVKTFNELTVLQKELNDNILIFQPVAPADEISSVDMQSLADVLSKLRDDGQIDANILLLPPNINVFKAVLARPDAEGSNTPIDDM